MPPLTILKFSSPLKKEQLQKVFILLFSPPPWNITESLPDHEVLAEPFLIPLTTPCKAYFQNAGPFPQEILAHAESDSGIDDLTAKLKQ